MHLVQILLPVRDKHGQPHEPHNRALKSVLTEKFGGVTAYTRAPAAGRWMNEGHVEKDDIVIVEVMADTLDKEWWAGFRAALEKDLAQEEIVIRTFAIEKL